MNNNFIQRIWRRIVGREPVTSRSGNNNSALSSAPVPVFNRENWLYQSFLIPDSSERDAAAMGDTVAARKWAMGKLTLSLQENDGGASSSGIMEFPQVGPAKIELDVELMGIAARDDAPATYEINAKGKGVIHGAQYQLTGWVTLDDQGFVDRIQGSVRAVSGATVRRSVELGGEPIGTIGSFIISKRD